MHTVQYITVKANSAAEAVEAASITAGEARWSDWFAIGGRWEDNIATSFPAIAEKLDDGNVLPVWEFPVETLGLLKDVSRRQNRAFLEARDAIAGNAVAVSDIPGHIFGMPGADSVGAARRLTESNQRSAAEWQKILSASSLEEAQNADMMASYYAQRMLSLLDDVWNPESGYYDAYTDSCNPNWLRETLSKRDKNAEQTRNSLFIVTVDFHF